MTYSSGVPGLSTANTRSSAVTRLTPVSIAETVCRSLNPNSSARLSRESPRSFQSTPIRLPICCVTIGADPGEAPGEPRVLGDEFLTEGEYGHQRSNDSGALARSSIAAHRSISASNGSPSSASMRSASMLA